MSEPRSELARYAFGYSDKKPGWLFWLIHVGMVAFIVWVVFSGHAQARCFTIWKYPSPQRCTTHPQARIAVRAAAVPVKREDVKPGPLFDLLLPDADPAITALKEQMQ